jgi:uncharacterized tellurite resistance protein B-like protein
MLTLLVILLSLWTFAVLAGVVVYWRYTHSPLYRWRQQVFAHFVRLITERNDAEYTLDVLDSGNDAIAEVKRTFALTMFANVSVETLTRYPGIGPMTITRLREAGLTTVAEVFGVALPSIANINRQQQTALQDALLKMHREALSRLSAQASPEAVAAAAELAKLTAGQQQQRHEANQKKALAEAGLAALATRMKVAEQIRFINYLSGMPPLGYTPEFAAQPLPLPVAIPLPPPTTPATPPTELNAPLTPTTPAEQMKPGELPSLTRFRVVARFGYAVAKADGRTSANEKRQIRVFLERRYATAPYLVNKLSQLIAEVEQDIPTLDESIAEVRSTLPKENWAELNQFAISVTDASGDRNARKNEVLARVATALEMTIAKPAPVPAVVIPPPPPATPTAPAVPKPLTDNECKKLLEIAFDTVLSVDLIRRQHRLLSERYDPAKFAAHGAEFVQLAQTKRDTIQKAALQLLKPYNEPLELPTLPPPTDMRHNPDLDDFFG